MRKPNHSELKVLAGDPLILAASERDRILAEWEKRDRVYRAAMRWEREMRAPGTGNWKRLNIAVTALLRACAAAKGKK